MDAVDLFLELGDCSVHPAMPCPPARQWFPSCCLAAFVFIDRDAI